jgi:Holliday junction resolvase-like predicted endonuclease
MKTQDKGACAEHIAAGALLRNGYEVYWNTSFHGLADLLVQRDGTIYRVQVKSFYDKRVAGKYRTEKSVYRMAECQTSNTTNGAYHVSYDGLVDMLVLVDTDTGEVFSIPPGLRKTQVHKSAITEYRIFPIPA